MEQFAVVTSLATLALSILVAIRLFLVARRTRGAPEIAMGVYQGLIVSAIVVYTVVLRGAETLDPTLIFRLVVVANLLIAAGVVALSIGIMRIYRPTEGWATALCFALIAWVLAGWAWSSVGETLPTTVVATPANAFFVTGRATVYLWGAFEGIRYHRMMRRRAALGLGDPVIAHRILLWGLFSLTMGTLAVASISAGWALGDAYATWMPGRFITPVMSLVASVLLWLGFFPPAAYERFVARHAPTASNATA
jgi:hypothetical protein